MFLDCEESQSTLKEPMHALTEQAQILNPGPACCKGLILHQRAAYSIKSTFILVTARGLELSFPALLL